MAQEKQIDRTDADKAVPTPPGFTLRHTLRGHAGTVFGVSWSPDGADAGLGVRRRDGAAVGGVERPGLRTLEGHAGPVYGVSWSPDGADAGLGVR